MDRGESAKSRWAGVPSRHPEPTRVHPLVDKEPRETIITEEAAVNSTVTGEVVVKGMKLKVISHETNVY